MKTVEAAKDLEVNDKKGWPFNKVADALLVSQGHLKSLIDTSRLVEEAAIAVAYPVLAS